MPELLVILAIVLLLFGSTKIPQLMRGLGQGLHEFKKGAAEGAATPTEPEKPKQS
jgi:sec-independent protein translocase protein TatA